MEKLEQTIAKTDDIRYDIIYIYNEGSKKIF